MIHAGYNLMESVQRVARVHPDRIALLAHGQTPTRFSELVAMVQTAVTILDSAGVTAESRVATLLPDGPETAVAILSIASTATCIPINPAYPATEVARLLREARATHVVTDAAHAMRLELPRLVLHPEPSGPAGAFTLETPPAANASAVPAQSISPNRVALVLHTSGSTGSPKRVPLTVANLASSSANLASSLALNDQDICFNMMPMFHIGALVDLMLAPLGAGGAVAFAREISTPALFAGLAEFRPTWFQAVPTVLRDILSHDTSPEEEAHFRRLRLVRAVSQPLPPLLHATFQERFGVKLVPIFGMTETAGLITSVPLDAQVPGSVGIAYGCEVRVVDGFGNTVPAGRRGEVVIAGPNVMAGYENTPEAEVFRGAWLRSGDEGYLDDQGFLFLTGRLKDVINRGGEKISPLEIDLLLADHPQIVEAAAFAVPHPTLGEEVAVAVVRRSELSSREVIDHLRGRVADFQLPRQVVFLDSLPRVPSGKLDRLALPTIAVDGVARKTRTPPDTPIAKTLAAMWRETLDVEDVALEDDFFDLGGDSLRATTLAIQLEERFGRTIPLSELFDAPILAQMAEMLSSSATRAATDNLDPQILASLTRIMAGWRGKRLPGSLIVGRNTLGQKNPFFWVPQTLHGFEALAGCLDPDRPIYAMTSLSHTSLKSDENTCHLADYYAGQILSIRPEGPFLLGGFCQGGVVAFHIAKALRTQGHDVGLLALQDRFIPEPYDGTIAMFWSKPEWYSIYGLHEDPEHEWGKYYTGSVSVHLVDAEHFELHNPPHLEVFAQQLEAAIEAAETGAPLPRLPV